MGDRTTLYRLTQSELHAAQKRAGYTEHEHMHDLTCTEVWVDKDGVTNALYEYWAPYEDEVLWCKLWVSMRDGALVAEY